MTISPALFPAVTVTVVRDRKIRIALRTNQIAGFVTVPSWKKIIDVIRYEPHTSSVGPFKIFFQQLHCFVQL